MNAIVEMWRRATRDGDATALLVRRWPERRAVVLAASALLFAGVFVAMRAASDPALAPGLLGVVPVMLVALELGLRGGLAAAALATALVTVNAVGGDPQLGAGGVATRALVFVAVGVIAGRFSDRMRDAHHRERRLLDSGLELAGVAGLEPLPDAITAAALRTPGAIGAVVELEGAPTARAGRSDGPRAVVSIGVRDAVRGRIELVHESSPAPEERAALELLALQAGLAADNQRLLEREREAAAVEARLRQVRDDLLEQRSGLGHVLEAQEGERRRVAEKLHEDLAQVLAAVLLGLRLLRREASGERAVPLDELHQQVVGVLDDVRNVAAALRPSSLGQLGVRPALEGLAERARNEHGCRVELDLGDLAEPLPEPLRTGVYRIIEQAIAGCESRGRAHVSVDAGDHELEVGVVLPLGPGAAVALAAARARAELLGGSVTLEPVDGHTTRMRIRLPLADLTASAHASGGASR